MERILSTILFLVFLVGNGWGMSYVTSNLLVVGVQGIFRIDGRWFYYTTPDTGITYHLLLPSSTDALLTPDGDNVDIPH
jgi:hypothetical protein